MEHFVGSLLGIIILDPGYKVSLTASVSSSADVSWIILFISKVVNYKILSWIPVVASVLTWDVTYFSLALKSTPTSKLRWPINWTTL
jgi:hypothetical protein